MKKIGQKPMNPSQRRARISKTPYYSPTGLIFLDAFGEKHGIKGNTVRFWLDRMGVHTLRAKTQEGRGLPRRAINHEMAEKFLAAYGTHGLPTVTEWLDVMRITGGPAADGGWARLGKIRDVALILNNLQAREMHDTKQGPASLAEWSEAWAALSAALGSKGWGSQTPPERPAP